MSEADVADGVVEETPWVSDEGGFTVTLKAGKGYEDSWFVLRDKTVNGLKRRLIEAFNWGPTEDTPDPMELSLIALVTNATQEFHALGTIGATFPGARAVSGRSRGRGRANDPEQPTEETPAKPVDPNAALLAEIEECTTVDALKRIWARENTAGRPLNEVTKAAWNAKGKALSGGSK